MSEYASDQKSATPMNGAADLSDDFAAKASSAFAREVFEPMFKRASDSPSDVRRLISEFRAKLEALDTVLATIPDSARPVNGAPASVARANGHEAVPEQTPSDHFDDIGRNQRSRLRELTLLEFIARETRPYSLQQILSELSAKGFEDSSGAIVSQLHRLKKTGVIDQPAGGMYEMTDDGLKHLRKLRSSFGALVGERDGR